MVIVDVVVLSSEEEMLVEFLYVCYGFGAPCDCHRFWPVRRSISRFLCRHASLLQTFVTCQWSPNIVPVTVLPSSMIKQCKFENVPFSMPGRAAWIWLAQRAWTAKNEVCLLPKQLGEQVAKLQVRALWECEFMAHVILQVKALDFRLLDFKRNCGIVERSRDLLPVRPCRLQADNNDAHLLPGVHSMLSFVVAFLHEHVLAQLNFLRYWKVDEAYKTVWLMGRTVSETLGMSD